MKAKLLVLLFSSFYIHSLVYSSDNLTNPQENLEKYLRSISKSIIYLLGSEHECERRELFKRFINNNMFLESLALSEYMKKPEEFNQLKNFLIIRKHELNILSIREKEQDKKNIESLQNQLSEVIDCFEKCSKEETSPKEEKNSIYCSIQ